MRRALVSSALMLLLSCATTNGLTVEENRVEAERHEAEARAAREKYDPTAARTTAAPRGAATGVVPGDVYETYNPTEKWLFEADRQMRQAAAHLRAAREIEKSEEKECVGIPPETRAACPLLASAVTRVTETAEGVRLFLKPELDAATITGMLQCHLAFARAKGFERPSCPLFVKGMTIALEKGSVLVFSAKDGTAAEALRSQARRIFFGRVEDLPPSASLR